MPETKLPDQAAHERPQKPRDTSPHARVEDHRVIESSLEAGPRKKAGLLRRTLAVLGPGLITGAGSCARRSIWNFDVSLANCYGWQVFDACTIVTFCSSLLGPAYDWMSLISKAFAPDSIFRSGQLREGSGMRADGTAGGGRSAHIFKDAGNLLWQKTSRRFDLSSTCAEE
jgi:hypothetical protein